jgi:CRP/FNR family transcriptional regulator, dissimilatory nitrate respiration regulator
MIKIMSQDLLHLLKNVRHSRRSLASGEILYRIGDAASAVFHVERGAVRLERGGHTHAIATPGQPFAETALFRDSMEHDATAVTDSTVLAFPKAAVLLLLRAHPDLNLAFSAYLARQVERLRFQAEVLRHRSARERIMAYLTEAGAKTDTVTLDRSLTDIAQGLGLTREALYRTLAKLEANGTLVREGKRAFRLIP